MAGNDVATGRNRRADLVDSCALVARLAGPRRVSFLQQSGAFSPPLSPPLPPRLCSLRSGPCQDLRLLAWLPFISHTGPDDLARAGAHTHTHTRTHTHTHTHVLTRTHTHTHARTHGRTKTHTYTHTHTHTNTHTYTHTHIHTHTHTHTHTHKYTSALAPAQKQ